MINANKEKLASFLEGKMQYVIPFFQRGYIWKEENWEILWEHIYELLNELSDNKDIEKEHFIGTLITKQLENEQIGENKHELIDGQQRLTTIVILLKALHDTCDNKLPELKRQISDLIKFKNARGEIFYRIIHNKNDVDYFEKIINIDDIEDIDDYIENIKSDNKIIKAYKYFRKLFKDNKYTDEIREKIMIIILYKISVISMLLSKEDDEQEIFDTINSLGVKLTVAELLKNYIFKDQEIRNLYEEYWQNVFEAEEELIRFWEKEKTSGRINRTNIEVLLYCYLIIKNEKEVKLDFLYKEYKLFLKDKTQDEKIEFLKELKEYSEIYLSFPSNEQLNEICFSEHENRFFHTIENLNITTVYPLVLYIYKNISDLSKRIDILRTLESYLIRRTICKLTAKNYNNLFISIMSKWKKKSELSISTFREILDSFKEDSNRFPNNKEFEEKFIKSHLYNAYSNEILYSIALKQKDNDLTDVRKLSSNSFTVEHIMPKKWETNWKLENITDEKKTYRNNLLLTLGNLTLITGYLNSKMRNSSWESKKEILRQHSSLKITTDYLNMETWDEVSILKRSKDLFDIAICIWGKEK